MPASSSRPPSNSRKHSLSLPAVTRTPPHILLSGQRNLPQPSFRILSQAVRCFVLPDKLTMEQRKRVYDDVIALGALQATIEYTNLILTSLRAPKRVHMALQRERGQKLTGQWFASIPILHLDWLADTAERGIMQDYQPYRISPSQVKVDDDAAIPLQTLLQQLPDSSSKSVRPKIKREHSSFTDDDEASGKARGNRREGQQRSLPRDGEHDQDEEDEEDDELLLTPTRKRIKKVETEDNVKDDNQEETGEEQDKTALYGSPHPVRGPGVKREGSNAITSSSTSSYDPAPPWTNSEFCCLRPTPLRSLHNQSLVDELEVIRKQRALTSQQWSERSYSGCLSAIKAYPFPICSQDLKTVRDLKGVGKKMIGLIEQYCEQGHIVEAQQIRSDPANDILFGFMELYGVGPVAARALYEEGCRTFEEVIDHGKSLATQLTVVDCYRILPDLKTKIPRVEVEEIARLIHEEVNEILPDTVTQIVGGYRRGKSMSNDVDIVITSDHADFSKRLDVLNLLLDNLKRKGLMSYSVNVTGPSDGYETTGFVDIAEIVFLPPSNPEGIIPISRHRRVDLVFCSPRIYGACIVGWTGSRNFEKDIRRWASKGGFKFHSSGIVDLDTNELMETRSEEDVFRILRLPYMPPELRNCDA